MIKNIQDKAAGYPAAPVLIVDDEEETLLTYKRILDKNGINRLLLCQDSREASRLLVECEGNLSLLLLDLSMPHLTGHDLLVQAKAAFPHLPVIVVTGSSTIQDAVACMKSGANDYLLKPVESSRFLAAVKNALALNELESEVHSLKEQILRPELKNPETFASILTISPKMLAIFKYLEAIAASPRPVLITGESGVGKELIAHALHRLSRREGEFVAVNIAGLDDTVFSDTLFGHHKGAFTGAEGARTGLIEKARHGTLFLDEIGDLEAGSQLKLFRLLQENEYYKLGSDIKMHCQARIIAATSLDLNKKMQDNSFRRELYYRLITHHVHIPPLRERPEDLALLVGHLVEEAAKTLQKTKPDVPDELFSLLNNYLFPGNIRELQALLFNSVSISDTQTLDLSYIKEYLANHSDFIKAKGGTDNKIFKIITSSAQLPTLKEMEDYLFTAALQAAHGNQSLAAGLLGVSQPTLSRWLKSNPHLSEELK